MRTIISSGLMLSLVCVTSPAFANDAVDQKRQDAAVVEVIPAIMQTRTAEADDDSASLMTQQVIIGGLIVGGAFAVGLLATGSLATGIGAASAAVLTYTFLP